MAAQKNIKPYRPFGAFTHDEGLGELPNENVIIPSPPGPKKAPEAPDSTETKTDFPPTQPTKLNLVEVELSSTTPPPPVDETPIEQNFVVGKNATVPTVIALIGITIVTVFAVFAAFEIQPKLRGISIVKGLESSTKDLSASVGKVDETLSNLVRLISASEAEPTRRNPAQPTKGENVLGQSTRPSPTEDEYTNALKVLKTAALSAKGAVASAQKDLETFQSRIPVEFPERVKDIVEEARSLSSRSDGLLLDTKKVTDFYSTVSSVQIDLLPTIKSLLTFIVELSQSPNPSLYSDKLDSLKQTISSLETQTRALNVFLPEGLEKVQGDNLAVFALLSNYLKDLEEAIGTGSFRKFTNATQKLGLDLEVITTRAKTLELSYWQETGLLKKTKAFSTDLGNFSSKLSTFRKNNKLPLFN